METTWILSGIIVLLVALHVWEKVRFDGRERDLLNRLMSTDFREYVEGQTRLQAPRQPTSDGRLTAEQAADILADEGLLADQQREPPAVVRVS
jgi:hypothetical protein